MSSTVLCLVEHDADGIADGSLRALAVARSLAAQSLAERSLAGSPELIAVVFGSPGGLADSVAGDLAGHGVTEVYLVSADELTGYAPVAWARALEQLAAASAAAAVVAAATDRGSEVMAHLGALTGLPVAANCLAASATGDASWRVRRHRWGGSLLEEAELTAPCALLTVAADAGPADAGPVDAGPVEPTRTKSPAAAGLPVRAFTPALESADLLVRATESEQSGGGTSLATARVVIGGGRGVGGPDGFAVLEELASLLGGVVGVSRVVTSQGWRPHRQQVGQTGTKISPELYLACGISGAIQHMAGCQSAKHIVAVNTDSDAPIMSRAEYAVIGDLNEVIPALVAALRAAGRQE